LNEAKHEWARSSGQFTFLSAATPKRPLACPVSQRVVRKVPAAWSCCRQLSEVCDSPIVAAPMASPPLVTVDGGACVSMWTTGHEGAAGCGGRGDVQRGYVLSAQIRSFFPFACARNIFDVLIVASGLLDKTLGSGLGVQASNLATSVNGPEYFF
jgi:hypothetical protein